METERASRATILIIAAFVIAVGWWIRSGLKFFFIWLDPEDCTLLEMLVLQGCMAERNADACTIDVVISLVLSSMVVASLVVKVAMVKARGWFGPGSVRSRTGN